MTPASWMRTFVLSHPEYKQDSVVSTGVARDLMQKCHNIGVGVEHVPELHGEVFAPLL